MDQCMLKSLTHTKMFKHFSKRPCVLLVVINARDYGPKTAAETPSSIIQKFGKLSGDDIGNHVSEWNPSVGVATEVVL